MELFDRFLYPVYYEIDSLQIRLRVCRYVALVLVPRCSLFTFQACNLAAAVFVYFFLYESSRLTLEDVDNVSFPILCTLSSDIIKMYNDPRCKPWTSGSWVPEGYSSRTELKRAKPRPVSGATTSTERTLQDPESGGATIVGKDFVEKEERLAAPAPGPALT